MNPYFRWPLAAAPGSPPPSSRLPATSICNSTKVSQEKILRRLGWVGCASNGILAELARSVSFSSFPRCPSQATVKKIRNPKKTSQADCSRPRPTQTTVHRASPSSPALSPRDHATCSNLAMSASPAKFKTRSPRQSQPKTSAVKLLNNFGKRRL